MEFCGAGYNCITTGLSVAEQKEAFLKTESLGHADGTLKTDVSLDLWLIVCMAAKECILLFLLCGLTARILNAAVATVQNFRPPRLRSSSKVTLKALLGFILGHSSLPGSVQMLQKHFAGWFCRVARRSS